MAKKNKSAPKSDREIDRQFMANPMHWYNWPCLPVKRYRNHDLECGVMIAVTGHLTTVFVANMFALGGTKLRESLIDNKDVVRHVYADLDALQADDWIVD